MVVENQTTKLYVIIGSRGDYSERYEWVAGVFSDKDVAIALAEEKLRESRAADVLGHAYRHCERKVRINRRSFREIDSAIIQECGVNPGFGDADDFTVVETELNTWGHWESVKE